MLEVERASDTAKKCKSSRQTEDVVAELDKTKAQQEAAQTRKEALISLVKKKAKMFVSYK